MLLFSKTFYSVDLTKYYFTPLFDRLCINFFLLGSLCLKSISIGKAEAIAQAVFRGVGKKGKPRKRNPICLISEKVNKVRFPSISIFFNKKVAKKR